TTVAGIKDCSRTELCCLLGPDGGTGIFRGKKAAPFFGRLGQHRFLSCIKVRDRDYILLQKQNQKSWLKGEDSMIGRLVERSLRLWATATWAFASLYALHAKALDPPLNPPTVRLSVLLSFKTTKAPTCRFQAYWPIIQIDLFRLRKHRVQVLTLSKVILNSFSPFLSVFPIPYLFFPLPLPVLKASSRGDAKHSLPHLSCLPTMLIKMEDLILNLSLETSLVKWVTCSAAWTETCYWKHMLPNGIHSNDREGVPMAKAGRLCILKKEMAPLLQVVTSYSSPELMELISSFEHIFGGMRSQTRRSRIALGPTGNAARKGEASLPSLNELPPYSMNNRFKFQDLAINHFAFKNEIIAQMKYLYPEDKWEFTKVIREKFFQGRQKGREFDLEHLQKMLSALKERGKSSSCAARMQFFAHPSERGTTLAELSLLDSRRVQGYEENKRLAMYECFLSEPWESRFYELTRTGKEASPAGPTLKCPQTASPHQAASIAKCSATKQALSNTTDAEVGKPKVTKEVEGRKKKQIEQRPPLSVRSSRSSSPSKPTTPCSSLLPLVGESLRMNVGLDRGIKTSSTRRERIGESITEIKAGAITPKLIPSLGLCHTSESEALLLTKVVRNAKSRRQRDSKTTNATISLNCLGETLRTTRIEDPPLIRKHNGLACGVNDDLRLQEGKRQPPSSKDFFEGGA
nr:hypothetical protein [Tanacetum cinerariifolium]